MKILHPLRLGAVLTVLAVGTLAFVAISQRSNANEVAGQYSMELASGQSTGGGALTPGSSFDVGVAFTVRASIAFPQVDSNADTVFDAADCVDANSEPIVPNPIGCYSGAQWHIDYDEALVDVVGTGAASAPNVTGVPAGTCTSRQDDTFRLLLGCISLDPATPLTYEGGVFNARFVCIAPGTATFTLRVEDGQTASPTTVFNSAGTANPIHVHNVTVTCTGGAVSTSTPTNTPLASTSTPTNTPLASTSTPTNTPLASTSTPTNTPLASTSTPTNTPLASTNTPTVTPGAATQTPTNTPLAATNTPTNTPLAATNTPTNTPLAGTSTPTVTPGAATQTPTNTPLAATNTPTNTPLAATNTPTNTPVGATNTPTNTPQAATSTPTRTVTNTPVPASSTPTRTVTATPPVGGECFGDVTGDGKVTAKDIVFVAKALRTQNPAADVNEDGKVTVMDLHLVIKARFADDCD